MPRKKYPETVEGIDVEIDFLHELIAKTMEKCSAKMTLENLIKVIDAVGKNSLNLARMMKIRVELVNQQTGPGAMLRQTLLELEDEWPELKQLVADYPLYLQEDNSPSAVEKPKGTDEKF
ncbi:MAG TPA: hypothetical protein DIW44_03905 [Anaerolineaceae bacterium]|nr:hypothetical protein [Anaerolineaceae bacterium]